MLLTLKGFNELKAEKERLESQSKKQVQWIARQSGMIQDLESEIEALKEKLQIADQALRFINSKDPSSLTREALKQIRVF